MTLAELADSVHAPADALKEFASALLNEDLTPETELTPEAESRIRDAWAREAQAQMDDSAHEKLSDPPAGE